MAESAVLPVALVTGAGRGIGRTVAVRLSQARYRVALTARSEHELKQTEAACPEPCLLIPGDATDAAFVESCFGHVEAGWGPVSVLVASAGAGMAAPLTRTTDEQWHQMLDLNLTAPFRFIRRAVPAMTAAGYGRIVVIASVAAKHGEPYIAAYAASKHGVLGLVRAAAVELARTGVTVNAVCPGFVDTPMTERTVQGIVDSTGRTPEQARAALISKQPINRLVATDEVADAVLLCVGNGAITGQGINVDGGAVQS
jgi:NAD(P)-dependent dehydrogenase (short-subunit alcohol dehydrogenase family)